MEFGLHYSRFPSSPGSSLARTLADTARIADEGGIALLTLMDHWFQMEVYGGPPEPMLEGYTGLGMLAGITERLRLSLLVTGVTYRHPGLLAKTVTTLDVLSEGRAQLGLGAAWYEREHAGLGVPFPPLAERFERLEETVQICRQMWSDDDGPFEGRHYRLAETVCVPAPVQPGGPPVMIGGGGERRTLRLVAQYADACNLFGGSAEQVRHKLEVLDRHCADVGRDPAEVRRTSIVGTDPVAETDAFLAEVEALAGLGISLVTVGHDGADPVAWTEALVERVLPRLEGL